MTRRVDIVPHTHWDREWYSPFQTFRLRLVDLLDELLPQLEADPSYAHFLLDGQMAVVDDYLAVRPEAEERLRALATTGPGGDGALVRPARRVPRVRRDARPQPAARAAGGGRASAAPWTSATCPTCSATWPRCPSCSGCSASSTPWCGAACPSAIDRSGFWWAAPDGSTVRAEYLPAGLRQRRPRARRRQGARRAASASSSEEQGDLLTGPILWMNGTDHLLPQPWLGRVVAEANALDAGYELHICSLAEHVHGAPTDGPADLDGRAALRRARQPADGRGLEPRRREAGGRASPSARSSGWPSRCRRSSCPPSSWPGALLDEAWLEVIRNSAHDSICACSVDEVVRRRRSTASPRPPRSPRASPTGRSQALGATVGGRRPRAGDREPVGPHARRRRGDAAARRPRCRDGLPARVGQRPAERVLVDDTAVEVATVMVSRARVRAQHPRRSRIDDADGAELHRTSSARPAGTPRHARRCAEQLAALRRRPRRASWCASASTDTAGRHRAGPRRRRRRLRLAGLDRRRRPRPIR